MRWQHLSSVALVATLSIPTNLQAQFVIYNNQATFLAAVMNPTVDTFAGFSTTGTTPSPITRTVGTYGYSAFVTAMEDFFGAGSTENPRLSTNTATDDITFAAFTGGVGAIGGNFFTTNIEGGFESGGIVLTYVDALGQQSTTLIAPTTTGFFGVVSLRGAISSLTVSAVQPTDNFLFPTIGNFTLAQTTVPEPGTYALLATGLMGIGIAARRRRPSQSR